MGVFQQYKMLFYGLCGYEGTCTVTSITEKIHLQDIKNKRKSTQSSSRVNIYDIVQQWTVY